MIDVYEVVKKLIGEIDPVGDARVDKENLKNLEVAIDLVEKLIVDIDRVAGAKDTHLDSVRTAKVVAIRFFDRLGIEE